jgi:hypothetical protein
MFELFYFGVGGLCVACVVVFVVVDWWRKEK